MFKWKCPKCGALEACHGTGKCVSQRQKTVAKSSCGGLTCQCQNKETDDHGRTLDDPCYSAYCDHCGWEGPFPTLVTLPKLKEFAQATLKLNTYKHNDKEIRKVRVIFHEWVDTALDAFLGSIDCEEEFKTFGQNVLGPIFNYLSIKQTDKGNYNDTL